MPSFPAALNCTPALHLLATLRLRGGMPSVSEVVEGGGAQAPPDTVFFENFSFRGKELRIQQDTLAGHAHVLWDASRVLAGYLEVCPVQWQGKRVLDLGSGCGLTGLCVAADGARVTLTELPGQTSTLRENCEYNLAATPETWDVRDAVWGAVGEETAWGPVTDLGQDWDYILGADLIYSDDSTPHLMQTLLRSCTGATEFIMSFELRRKKDLDFLRDLAGHGFSFRKLPESELHGQWRAEEIGVFIVRRSKDE